MPDRQKSLRVAAYCRVSTDSGDQANSLASQKSYFSQYIQRNPLWELTSVYADEGVTGTSTKKRHAFNRMIQDAEAHCYDLILTKEISRFARNTLDSIFYTRKLKELGIGVLFLNDNINTLDPDAELRLTIMSSIAQEESRKTSDRVKWGQKRRMEQGVVFGRSMLGYDVRGGRLFVNEPGAEVVRLIFHKFADEGKGTHIIARELREAGISTHSAIKNWSNTVILRALRNEKYVGDLIQKKTITPNYLTHQKKYNNGEEDFVVLRGNHEPIISRTLFERAQEELKRRAPSDEQRSRHSSRYCFSGKLQCGLCGSTFVSCSKKRVDGSLYKAWRCSKAALHASTLSGENGCRRGQISHEFLLLAVSQAVVQLPVDKEALVARLSTVLRTALACEPENESVQQLRVRVQQTAAKKQKLIELLLNGDISKLDFEAVMARQELELERLERQLSDRAEREDVPDGKETALAVLAGCVRAMLDGEIQDETFFRGILDKIVIYNPTRLDIHFALLPQTFRCFISDPSEPLEEPFGVFPART